MARTDPVRACAVLWPRCRRVCRRRAGRRLAARPSRLIKIG